ncbi:MAG: hypothetical protein VX951_07105 [Planctomycetota bacterium]|nr:hypothetical protein [Planctomycetota bacterium]
MRPRVPCTALLLLATCASSCQTTVSGRAIGNRLGNSLQGLISGSGHFLTAEITRATTLPGSVGRIPRIRLGKLRGFLPAIQQGSTSIAAGIKDLPKSLRAVSGHALHEASQKLRALLSDRHPRLQPSAILQQWRTDLGKTADVLGLNNPVLPGPGDLDRTEDPHQVGRRLTWIERLLSRF